MTALLVSLLICGTQDFQVDSESLARMQDECTASSVYSEARRLAAVLGIAVPGVARIKLERNATFARHWTVHWPDILDGKFVARTGELLSLTDWKKMDQWYKQRPSAELVLRDVEACRSRARDLLTSLGVEQNVLWATVKAFDESETTRASISVSVKPYYRNVVVQTAYADLTIDRVDGRLLDLTKKWQFTAETTNATLQPTDGRLRAEQIYEANVAIPDRYPINAELTKLVYLRPAKGYGAVGYSSEEYPMRVRLAYITVFGKDRVYVDAVNGNCLGGYKSPQRPPGIR